MSLMNWDETSDATHSAGTSEHNSNASTQKTKTADGSQVLAAAEPPAAQRDVASLQSKVDSLERTVTILRNEIASLKRGFRSGLFEDVKGLGSAGPDSSPVTDLGFEDTLGAQSADVSSLEQSPSTSQPHVGEVQNSKDNPSSLATLKKGEEPNKLIEQALTNIQAKDPAAALVTLTTLRDRYPGFPDEGLGDVLMAECWNALNSPEKALSPVERFLSVHSTSALLPRAKLAQALAYRTLGERQKSIQLLLEVIALAPETKTADVARARLAELREIR
jgi:tetratricopeptide (TPR) repeat protein